MIENSGNFVALVTQALPLLQPRSVNIVNNALAFVKKLASSDTQSVKAKPVLGVAEKLKDVITKNSGAITSNTIFSDLLEVTLGIAQFVDNQAVKGSTAKAGGSKLVKKSDPGVCYEALITFERHSCEVG